MKKQRRLINRIKIKYILDRMDKVATDAEKFPIVFKDRMLKSGLLSFLIAVTGTFMGIQFRETYFIVFTWILTIFHLYQAWNMLRICKNKNYEMLEGIVVGIKGRHSLGRTYRITIQESNGQHIELMMDKRNKFTIGCRYRFYFNNKDAVQSGIKKLDAVLNINSFYGVEEIVQEAR